MNPDDRHPSHVRRSGQPTALTRGRSVRRAIYLGVALATALAMALPVGRRQHIGDDFAVFWQAGRNFATGAPLYHGELPGARPFKYPPFAALLFTPLALFSLPVAGVLMSLLNLGLWVAAVMLTRDILSRLSADTGVARWPLAVAVVLSGQFFMDNFHHVQVNEVTLVLVLLGVRAYLRGRDLRAAAAIVVATGLKITPIFFAAWLVVRGRRRAALAVFAFGVAVVLVPLLLRGPSRGAAELAEYYQGFLEKHQRGRIETYTGGQNVAALVSRMTQPPADTGTSYRWLPTGERTGQRIYQTAWLAILLLFLGKLVLVRLREAPVSAPEIAMVFLAALLLSPITFTTHLVPLLFVLAALLSRRDALRSAPRPVLGFTALGAAVCGLSGRDLVGGHVYHAVGGYSVCGWTLLMLFAISAAGRPRIPPFPSPARSPAAPVG